MYGDLLKPIIKVSKTFDNTDKITRALEILKRTEVMVGIPQDKAARPNGGINNAQLAFLHSEGFKAPKWAVFNAYSKRFEDNARKKASIMALQAYFMEKGSPFFTVHPRPFLQPAIEANKDRIAKQQKKILQAALSGDIPLMNDELIKLGLLGQMVVKAWFVDPRNGWAPNNPLIVKIKGSDKPLIDTGELRNSINYVVREK